MQLIQKIVMNNKKIMECCKDEESSVEQRSFFTEKNKKYKKFKISLAFLKICGIILLVFDTRV